MSLQYLHKTFHKNNIFLRGAVSYSELFSPLLSMVNIQDSNHYEHVTYLSQLKMNGLFKVSVIFNLAATVVCRTAQH